jgi:hypothetical protein
MELGAGVSSFERQSVLLCHMMITARNISSCSLQGRNACFKQFIYLESLLAKHAIFTWI